MYAADILDRAQIPFIVLGNIAYQMKYGLPLSDVRATFAILERHAVPECTSMIPIIEPNIEQRQDGWRVMYHDFPVVMKVITKEFPTLADPDVVFYWVENWKIPNPFEKYWQGDHYDV
jgi:hypothetical protein